MGGGGGMRGMGDRANRSSARAIDSASDSGRRRLIYRRPAHRSLMAAPDRVSGPHLNMIKEARKAPSLSIASFLFSFFFHRDTSYLPVCPPPCICTSLLSSLYRNESR